MQIITICDLSAFTCEAPVYVVDADTNTSVGPTRHCNIGYQLGESVLTIAQAYDSNIIYLTGNPIYANKIKEDIYIYAAQQYSNKEITVIIQ